MNINLSYCAKDAEEFRALVKEFGGGVTASIVKPAVEKGPFEKLFFERFPEAVRLKGDASTKGMNREELAKLKLLQGGKVTPEEIAGIEAMMPQAVLMAEIDDSDAL